MGPHIDVLAFRHEAPAHILEHQYESRLRQVAPGFEAVGAVGIFAIGAGAVGSAQHQDRVAPGLIFRQID